MKTETKEIKKQFVLALAPLFALCLIVFLCTARGSFSKSVSEENSAAVETLYSAEEQKAEVPSHEPVYISILKFIVNCNPFQKESQL